MVLVVTSESVLIYKNRFLEKTIFSGLSFASAEAQVKVAANDFINSPNGFLVIIDGIPALPVGILTLRDLLRAQPQWRNKACFQFRFLV
jgi:hypothetical protein